MKTAGIVVLLLAIVLASGVAYLIWGQLVPYVAGLVPDGDWSPFLRVCIYVAIGLLGGVGLPIFILVFGFGLATQMM